jgi:4-diphosphocytidyl-2-C-methyl-D-erythritol kinase
LGLSVGARRADGYHNLTSVFCLLELADTLVFSPSQSGEFELSTSVDLAIPPQQNLVWRAAQGMACLHGRDISGLSIHIEKRIPAGAGLAGGSSNAAATIRALADRFGVAVHDPRHVRLAAELGSDVPVFLADTCISLMGGRGDVLQDVLPALPAWPVVVALPAGAHSDTGMVYRAFDADPAPEQDAGGLVAAIRAAAAAGFDGTDTSDAQSDVRWEVCNRLFNNLRAAAVAVSPATGRLLERLWADDGVCGADISGSGSSCYAIMRDAASADALAAQLTAQGYWATSTRLLA